MARKVFFSFKYDDVERAKRVRNSNAISADNAYGFIEAADFEAFERQGDAAIEVWIGAQLAGTTVTVVLIGANTDQSKWVKYEIDQSIARGNGILTIDISKIATLNGEMTDCCNVRVRGYNHYLWNSNYGHTNLRMWIENAAKAANKA